MKKFLCILLSAFLITAVFTGCSDSGESSEDYSTRIVTDSHYSDIDESTYRVYEKMCSAVINYESEVTFNIQLLDDAAQLFYTSFPLNSLVENIDIISDNSGVEITYANDSETHSQMISEFYEKVDEILEACNISSSSKDMCVFNIYNYVTTEFQIDASVVTTYDAIMQGRGAAATINSAFEYLVLSAGGNASHVINIDSNSIISLAEFSSTVYFFDAAGEISDNSGTVLKYFAMDSIRVSDYAGDSFTYTDGETAQTVEDETYSDLSSSVSYSVDDSTVTVQLSDNQTFEFEIV